MLRYAVVLLCAMLACLPAKAVYAALEAELDLSPLPEVMVSYDDITGSVHRDPSCLHVETRPIVIFDHSGHVVALVYVTRKLDRC